MLSYMRVINHLIFTYGSKQIIIFLKIWTILLSVACVYLFSAYCFKYLYLFSLIILGGVCVCVCVLTLWALNKLNLRLPSVPLALGSAPSVQTSLDSVWLISVKTVWSVFEGQPVLHFLPGSFCLDFWTLHWNTSCQRCVCDFSWIYFCWLVEITQCLYAATFLTPCCPADCSTTRRWNVMHSAVGSGF